METLCLAGAGRPLCLFRRPVAHNEGVGGVGIRGRTQSPQLSPTGRPEALAPGNPCVLRLTHPPPPVQTAPGCAPPRRPPLRQAAAAGWRSRRRGARGAAASGGGPAARGGSDGMKMPFKLPILAHGGPAQSGSCGGICGGGAGWHDTSRGSGEPGRISRVWNRPTGRQAYCVRPLEICRCIGVVFF
jgi:hypothetical protein